MPDLLRSITDTFQRLGLRDVLDIALIAGIICWLLVWLRGTSAMSLLRGVAIVAAVGLLLGNLFDLTVVNWLLRNSLTALLVAIPIIFQPEIRRALERVGRAGIRTWRGRVSGEGLNAVVAAVAQQCSQRRQGALLILEGETGLEEYAATGVRLDALPSAPLLMSIFYSNSPLHDGAVVIREGRIAAASCMLPLSESAVSYAVGTRHRAALGISERADALAVVVSEETGDISLAFNGRLTRPVDPPTLFAALQAAREGGARALEGNPAEAGTLAQPAVIVEQDAPAAPRAPSSSPSGRGLIP
ncbi:MAG TPA: diadenylate cyclase CdaA [Dehalococcoidia bacterium]|nr:diadenylate cyclase CdaA [Dehalococcoidia bacterium]